MASKRAAQRATARRALLLQLKDLLKPADVERVVVERESPGPPPPIQNVKIIERYDGDQPYYLQVQRCRVSFATHDHDDVHFSLGPNGGSAITLATEDFLAALPAIIEMLTDDDS